MSDWCGEWSGTDMTCNLPKGHIGQHRGQTFGSGHQWWGSGLRMDEAYWKERAERAEQDAELIRKTLATVVAERDKLFDQLHDVDATPMSEWAAELAAARENVEGTAALLREAERRAERAERERDCMHAALGHLPFSLCRAIEEDDREACRDFARRGEEMLKQWQDAALNAAKERTDLVERIVKAARAAACWLDDASLASLEQDIREAAKG
jgi:hypothetical protein